MGKLVRKVGAWLRRSAAGITSWVLTGLGAVWGVMLALNHFGGLPNSLSNLVSRVEAKIGWLDDVLAIALFLVAPIRYLYRRERTNFLKELLPYYSALTEPNHRHLRPLSAELLTAAAAYAQGVGSGRVDFSDSAFLWCLDDPQVMPTAYPEYLYYWSLTRFVANHRDRLTEIAMAHYFPARGVLPDFVNQLIASQRQRPEECKVKKVYRFPSTFEYYHKNFEPAATHRFPDWYRQIQWPALLLEEYHAGSQVFVAYTDANAPRTGGQIREIGWVWARDASLIAEACKDPTNFRFASGTLLLVGEENRDTEPLLALRTEFERVEGGAPWKPSKLEYAAASAYNIWFYTRHGDRVHAFDSISDANELNEWREPGTERWLVRHACAGAHAKGLTYRVKGPAIATIAVRRVVIVPDDICENNWEDLLVAIWVQEMVGIKVKVITTKSYDVQFDHVKRALGGYPDYVVIAGKDRCKCVGWHPLSLWYPLEKPWPNMKWPNGVKPSMKPDQHFGEVWKQAKGWAQVLTDARIGEGQVQQRVPSFQALLKNTDPEAFQHWQGKWEAALRSVYPGLTFR